MSAMFLKIYLLLFPMSAISVNYRPIEMEQFRISAWFEKLFGSFGGYTCYGDVNKLNPTGMHGTGVPGSNAAVDYDLNDDLNSLKKCYVAVGNNICIQPAVIAALASRESRGGRLLIKTHGWGDHHHAWGILQCDVRYHNDCLKYGWNSCAHIKQMVSEVLVPYIIAVKRKFPDWSADQQLQGGIAAYNFGVANVRSWANLDIGTTGNDYSNDVVARAKRLINAHGWD